MDLEKLNFRFLETEIKAKAVLNALSFYSRTNTIIISEENGVYHNTSAFSDEEVLIELIERSSEEEFKNSPFLSRTRTELIMTNKYSSITNLVESFDSKTPSLLLTLRK